MSNPTREMFDKIELHTRPGSEANQALQTLSGEILMQAGVLPNGDAMVFYSRRHGVGDKPELRTIMLRDEGEQFVLVGSYTAPMPIETVEIPHPEWWRGTDTEDEKLARKIANAEGELARKRVEQRLLENEIVGLTIALEELQAQVV